MANPKISNVFLFDQSPFFLKFPYFDGMHRFLPALYKGFESNTFFIEVNHRARFSGISKYDTIGRLFKGIKDLVKVYFLLRKRNK